jgi:NADPH-dependent 2,4-dienoyl-CoA reductase/sulfur reductase-like enzyme
VNPRAAQEGKVHIDSAKLRKKVVVVGAGPGGLIAAKVLAERGHQVTLYEKESRLGGQLGIASLPPGKKSIQRFERYMIGAVEKAGVDIRAGRHVKSETIEEDNPDALVVATGSKPIVPSIPGIQMSHVITARNVLLGKAITDDPVVILGGGQVGLEVAEFLAEKQKKVAVIEVENEVGRGMPSVSKFPLLRRLEELGVTIWRKAKTRKIINREMIIEYRGSERRLKAHTIVIAVGTEPNRTLFDKTKVRGVEVYVIGDAAQPRRILEAVHEGLLTATKI